MRTGNQHFMRTSVSCSGALAFPGRHAESPKPQPELDPRAPNPQVSVIRSVIGNGVLSFMAPLHLPERCPRVIYVPGEVVRSVREGAAPAVALLSVAGAHPAVVKSATRKPPC